MSTNRASNLKSTLEITGLVAVVIGLAFVGIEIRQNTAAVQAETLQGLNDSSQEFLLVLASDSELVEIQQKVLKNPDSLNEIEGLRYTLVERTRWLRSQNAYFQHQRGTLGDADWETYARLLCTRHQSFWPAHRVVLADEFVSFVESRCGWRMCSLYSHTLSRPLLAGIGRPLTARSRPSRAKGGHPHQF